MFNKSNHYQSAYRKFRSNETAILKIHNGIMSSMYYGRVTALTLLDLHLSAAFNTIDHTIPLRRFDNWFAVIGKPLNCYTSHLSKRCQRNKLCDCLSSKADLPVGVPQGSVLGPLLFTLITTPLSSMISEHGISDYLYADDSQLYVSFASRDSSAALNSLPSAWPLSSHGCQ